MSTAVLCSSATVKACRSLPLHARRALSIRCVARSPNVQPARDASARSSSTPAPYPAEGNLGDAAKKGNAGLMKYVLLGAMFAGWYSFNIVFNIFNKQVLTTFHFPFTCTTYQFLIGSFISLGWFAATRTRIDTSKETLKAVLPLAVVHTLANLLTNVSLGMVAVSFTHTIKAMEPFFSVFMSAAFLGEGIDPWVLLSLVPIIGGVAGASLSEATFNWAGFLSAMGSNLTFQSRNVFSKKFLTPEIKQKVGGSIGLFSLITMMSFCLLLPVTLIMEGVRFTPGAVQALGVVEPAKLFQRASGAAFTFHMYQQVSYMILSRVSPVTHSIGNCVKRVVVIFASVLFFGNPMSNQSKISTAVALAGVFAYSQVKRIRSGAAKPKAA